MVLSDYKRLGSSSHIDDQSGRRAIELALMSGYNYRDLYRLLGEPDGRAPAAKAYKRRGKVDRVSGRRYFPDLLWSCGCRAAIAHGGNYELVRCARHEAEKIGSTVP